MVVDMKKLFNAIPLIIAIALLIHSCQDISPSKTISPSKKNLNIYQVREGSVYDGDTLRVLRNGEELKIRFCGIDAPERSQELGIASRDYLRSLINKTNSQVSITAIEKDRYGRTVAELFATDGTFINAEVVRAGLAYHYERYSGNCPNKSAIAQAEEEAKKLKRGVWKNPNSIPPWEYRRKN